MDFDDFRQKYEIEISELKMIDIRYTINRMFQTLSFCPSKLVHIERPTTPMLIEIALKSKKGCGEYSRLLSKKRWLESKIGIRDQKWHLELETYYDVSFWNRIRHLNTKISFNNDLKWLQYRIIRNCLQTNYIISNFLPGKTPLCTFCGQFDEKISHLFWHCSVVYDFISSAMCYVQSLGLDFNPTMKEFLFGDLSVPFDHPKNFLSLLIKRFIWQTKFRNINLSLNGLKNALKVALNELKIIYELKEKNSLFNEWVILYLDLYQEDHQPCP